MSTWISQALLDLIVSLDRPLGLIFTWPKEKGNVDGNGESGSGTSSKRKKEGTIIKKVIKKPEKKEKPRRTWREARLLALGMPVCSPPRRCYPR